MKFGLLARKLALKNERFAADTTIREYCKGLGLDYDSAIGYLLRHGYARRILRGFFYVPTVDERKFKTEKVSHLEAIARAMEYKGVKNWYFGLETALKLNNVTHEYFTLDYVISAGIFRSKPITVLGHGVKFVKLSSRLFGFGIKKRPLPFSDVEKTILDMVHIGRYGGKSMERMEDEAAELCKHISKRKMKEYAKHYSKPVRDFVERIVA